MKKTLIFVALFLFIGAGCTPTPQAPVVSENTVPHTDATGVWSFMAPAAISGEMDSVTLILADVDGELTGTYSGVRIGTNDAARYFVEGDLSGSYDSTAGVYHIEWQGDREDSGVAELAFIWDGVLSWVSDITAFDGLYTIPTRMTFLRNDTHQLTDAQIDDASETIAQIYAEVDFPVVSDLIMYHSGIAKFSVQPAESVAEKASIYMEPSSHGWEVLLGPVGTEEETTEVLLESGIREEFMYY